MDLFHWAGLALGAVICVGALLLAAAQKALTPMHAVVIAIGAVLAGVPVITMSFGAQPSFQIGQVAQAASQTNAATQSQGEAVAKLNDRVTQLASLVSKLPIATTSAGGLASVPSPAPAATNSAASAPAGSSLVIPTELLPAWKRDVAAFQRSGSEVQQLNTQSQRLTASSETSLAKSGVAK